MADRLWSPHRSPPKAVEAWVIVADSSSVREISTVISGGSYPLQRQPDPTASTEAVPSPIVLTRVDSVHILTWVVFACDDYLRLLPATVIL
jgi:hypothetical protein